jgi:hypothetical protein
MKTFLVLVTASGPVPAGTVYLDKKIRGGFTYRKGTGGSSTFDCTFLWIWLRTQPKLDRLNEQLAKLRAYMHLEANVDGKLAFRFMSGNTIIIDQPLQSDDVVVVLIRHWQANNANAHGLPWSVRAGLASLLPGGDLYHSRPEDLLFAGKPQIVLASLRVDSEGVVVGSGAIDFALLEERLFLIMTTPKAVSVQLEEPL